MALTADPVVGSLFSGYGGLDLAVETFYGARTAWHVEWDAAPARVLAVRWPGTPNHVDVAAVDWSRVEPVDVLCGGFPCQDLSLAGRRRGLTPDSRSGLWSHFALAIDRLRPSRVVIENVRGLLSAGARRAVGPGDSDVDAPLPLRAMGAVLGDLADLGYDADWQGLRAAEAGAPHARYRIFIVARPAGEAPADTSDLGPQRLSQTEPPGRLRSSLQPAAEGRREAPPDPDRDGAGGHRPREVGGPPAAPDPDDVPGNFRAGLRAVGSGRLRSSGPRDDRSADRFGVYADAVRRWEQVLGRAAPSPLAPGPHGGARLNPAFAEWMMGLPEYWVTHPDLGLTRLQQIKALGNGVVPQQALLALSRLDPAYAPAP